MSGYVPYKSMQIIETGLRPGEKLYEELLTDRETCRKTANDLIYIETEQPPTREEVDGELDILRQAVEASADEVESPLIRAALKQVVPTFKEPDEVNRDAENAAEMQNAIDLENPGRARAQKSQDEKEDEKKERGESPDETTPDTAVACLHFGGTVPRFLHIRNRQKNSPPPG